MMLTNSSVVITILNINRVESRLVLRSVSWINIFMRRRLWWLTMFVMMFPTMTLMTTIWRVFSWLWLMLLFPIIILSRCCSCRWWCWWWWWRWLWRPRTIWWMSSCNENIFLCYRIICCYVADVTKLGENNNLMRLSKVSSTFSKSNQIFSSHLRLSGRSVSLLLLLFLLFSSSASSISSLGLLLLEECFVSDDSLSWSLLPECLLSDPSWWGFRRDRFLNSPFSCLSLLLLLM